MVNWIKQYRHFFYNLLCVAFMVSFFKELLLGSNLSILVFAVCIITLSTTGCLIGIDQVKQWEREQAEHWLEEKEEIRKESE